MIETEKPQPEDPRAEHQKEVALILMKHFSAHQDAVFVVSIGEQGIMAGVSPLPNLSAGLILKEFGARAIQGAIDDALMAMRKANEAKEKTPPPDGLDGAAPAQET